MTEPSPVKSEEMTNPVSETIYATARDDAIKPVVIERKEEEAPEVEVQASPVQEKEKAQAAKVTDEDEQENVGSHEGEEHTINEPALTKQGSTVEKRPDPKEDSPEPQIESL